MKITVLLVSILLSILTTAVSGEQDCTALANSGNCSFYDCLSNKFGCSSTDYPLAYGRRYCQRFEDQKTCFTTAGQTWISNVRACLMRAIINNNAYTDPNTTCAQLETIGFESHPSCYVDNGFCTDVLTSFDNLVCLGNNVFNLRDFLSKQALNQVLVTASRCAQNLISQFLQSVSGFLSRSEAFLGTLRDYLGSCNSGIDLIFILDSSGSIGGANFVTMKTFVANVISNFDIASNGTRVGVIRFSASASIVIPLGSINNNVSLINAVNAIAYIAGGTRTDLALDLLPTAFATARVSQGVPRVAVVLTDGRSNEPTLTISSAAAVHAAGITVYSFGIGNGIRMNELVTIANATSNVFLINNFSPDSFATQLQPLRASTCTTPFPGDIGTELEGISLERGHSRLLQYSLPPEGLTVAIDVQDGGVIVRGSFTIRNPTPITADFTVQSNERGDRDINYYVSPDLYKSSTNRNTRKREVTLGEDNRQVYLSIVGLLEGNNTFSLNTTVGDTSSAAMLGINLGLVTIMMFIAIFFGFATVM